MLQACIMNENTIPVFNVDVCEKYIRTGAKVAPEKLLAIANDDISIFSTFENHKWNIHPFKRVMYINTNAEQVLAPLPIIGALIDAMYWKVLNHSPTHRVLSTQFMSGVKSGAEVLKRLQSAFRNFVYNHKIDSEGEVPSMFHYFIFERTPIQEDHELLRRTLESAFETPVYVISTSPDETDSPSSFMVLSQSGELLPTFSMNRIKIITGKQSCDITHNIVYREDITKSEFKALIQYLLFNISDIILDSRIYSKSL